MFVKNQSSLLKNTAIRHFSNISMTGVWEIPVGYTMKTDHHYEALLYCECDG